MATAKTNVERQNAMINGLESSIREQMKEMKAPVLLLRWVAGGGAKGGRARRFAILLWAKNKYVSASRESWPSEQICRKLGKLDAKLCEERRARGLAWKADVDIVLKDVDVFSLAERKKRKRSEIAEKLYLLLEELKKDD